MAATDTPAVPQVRASKGVHIVVPGDRIKLDTGLIVRQGGSVLFVIPSGDRRDRELGGGDAVPRRHWIIGTTDTNYELNDREHPVATAKDVRQVLDTVNAVLDIPLSEKDIVGVYAGLRPLVSDGTGDPTRVSRKHVVEENVDGLITVVGGKLTILRLMAKDAVDWAAKKLGTPAESQTSNRLLLGSANLEQLPLEREELARRAQVSPEWIDLLASRYGSLVHELVDLIESRPDLDLGTPLAAAPSYLRAEAFYAASHEGALNLEDVLTRHTHIDWETGDGGLAALDEVAELVGEARGWTADRIDEDRATFERHALALQQGLEATSDREGTAAFNDVSFFPRGSRLTASGPPT